MIPLTDAEASLVCDALKGTILDETSIPTMWLAVADGIRLNALGSKWHVADPDALVQRLRDLTSDQDADLAAAVSRFWARPELDWGAGLRAAGLIRDAAP